MTGFKFMVWTEITKLDITLFIHIRLNFEVNGSWSIDVDGLADPISPSAGENTGWVLVVLWIGVDPVNQPPIVNPGGMRCAEFNHGTVQVWRRHSVLPIILSIIFVRSKKGQSFFLIPHQLFLLTLPKRMRTGLRNKNLFLLA